MLVMAPLGSSLETLYLCLDKENSDNYNLLFFCFIRMEMHCGVSNEMGKGGSAESLNGALIMPLEGSNTKY